MRTSNSTADADRSQTQFAFDTPVPHHRPPQGDSGVVSEICVEAETADYQPPLLVTRGEVLGWAQAEIDSTSLIPERPGWMNAEEHDALEAGRVFLTRPDLAARFDSAWEEYQSQQFMLAQSSRRVKVIERAIQLGAAELPAAQLHNLTQELRSVETTRTRREAAPWSSVRSLRGIMLEHRLRDASSMAGKRWTRRCRDISEEIGAVDTYLLEALAGVFGLAAFLVGRVAVMATGLTAGPLGASLGMFPAVLIGVLAGAGLYQPKAKQRARRLANLHRRLSRSQMMEASALAGAGGQGVPCEGCLNEHELQLVRGAAIHHP